MLSGSGVFAAVFLMVAAGMATACGEEVFINTNLPFSIGNNTMLVIEDVNPQSGMVWAQIFNRSELSWSGVIRVGESYNGSPGCSFTITRIYAGGDGCLIGLDLHGNISETAVAPGNASDGRGQAPKKSPGMNAAGAVATAAVLALSCRRRRGLSFEVRAQSASQIPALCHRGARV
jgi:hypothetical protein